MDGKADREFATLAGEYLDDRAERHPSVATSLGDHRFDDRLPDLSAAALADERRALDGWAARLEALDAATLSAEHRVDAAMMAMAARWAPGSASATPRRCVLLHRALVEPDRKQWSQQHRHATAPALYHLIDDRVGIRLPSMSSICRSAVSAGIGWILHAGFLHRAAHRSRTPRLRCRAQTEAGAVLPFTD